MTNYWLIANAIVQSYFFPTFPNGRMNTNDSSTASGMRTFPAFPRVAPFCCHADQRPGGVHASPRTPVFHSSEQRHPARSRSSPQARLEPSTALQNRRPDSSISHLADSADAGIGSLPSQESVRAKRAMNDSRQYMHGNHVDGVVPVRESNLLPCRRPGLSQSSSIMMTIHKGMYTKGMMIAAR